MSSSVWMSKLNVSPEDGCRCGHNAYVHAHGKSCTAVIDEVRMRYCKCEVFHLAISYENQIEGEGNMEKKKGKKKTLLAIRYEVTAKDGKKFLEKDNASGTAVIYRALAAKGPLTIAECYEACKGKMESNAAWERLSKYAIISSLHKNGFLKKTERREEVGAKSAKPKRSAKPRAPKLPKGEPPTTAAERQAAAERFEATIA